MEKQEQWEYDSEGKVLKGEIKLDKAFTDCLKEKFRAKLVADRMPAEIGGGVALTSGGIGIGLGAVPAVKYLMKFFSK